MLYLCFLFRKNNVDNKFVEGDSGLKTEELQTVKGKELFKLSQTLVNTHFLLYTFFILFLLYRCCLRNKLIELPFFL